MATVNADGTLISTYITGPFGEVLPNQTTPKNATTDTSNSYVGAYQKMSESSLAISPIQMGARVYIPGIGRFMQVDPVEGGTENNYVYPSDSVNKNDISGKCVGWFAFLFVYCAAAATAVINILTVAVEFYGGGASSTIEKGAATLLEKTAAQETRAAASSVTSQSVKSSVESAVPQVRVNYLNGKAAEAKVQVLLESKYGTENVVVHPYYNITGLGRRFPDFQVNDAGSIFNVEVKSGNAAYGGLQQMKDEQINLIYNIPTKVMQMP